MHVFFLSRNTSCFAEASMVLPLIQVGNTRCLQWSVPACLVCWESLLSSLQNVCHCEKVTLKQKKQWTAEIHNYLIYISERSRLPHKLHTARFRHKPRCVQRAIAWLYSRTRWAVGSQSVSGGSAERSRYTLRAGPTLPTKEAAWNSRVLSASWSPVFRKR